MRQKEAEIISAGLLSGDERRKKRERATVSSKWIIKVRPGVGRQHNPASLWWSFHDKSCWISRKTEQKFSFSRSIERAQKAQTNTQWAALVHSYPNWPISMEMSTSSGDFSSWLKRHKERESRWLIFSPPHPPFFSFSSSLTSWEADYYVTEKRSMFPLLSHAMCWIDKWWGELFPGWKLCHHFALWFAFRRQRQSSANSEA